MCGVIPIISPCLQSRQEDTIAQLKVVVLERERRGQLQSCKDSVFLIASVWEAEGRESEHEARAGF